MDKDFDNVFTGTFVATVVCIISGLLYYLFKNNALSPNPNENPDLGMFKKKSKKPDTKKPKKPKTKKTTNGAISTKPDESEPDKASDDDLSDKPSDDNVEPLDPSHESSLSELKTEISEADSSIAVLKEDDLDNHPSTGYFQVDEFVIAKNSKQMQQQQQQQPVSDLNKSSGDDSDPQPAIKVTVTKSEIVTESSTASKPKKNKRRPAKKQPSSDVETFGSAAYKSFEPVVMAAHTNTIVETTTTTTMEASVKSNEHLVSELRQNIKKLESDLKASDAKFQELFQRSNSLMDENKRLRSKDEETLLGLHVLQGQYTELVRTNKSLEHDRNTKETKLKNIETEKSDLLKRLDQLNADTIRIKSEAEAEIRKLRDQLADTNSKMNAMAAAMSAAPPPGPSPELVRTQELAQTMSNDNRILKLRIEQLESERNQLHQSHVRQQQELQVLKSENRKLHADQESTLEELMAKRQAEQADVNSRLASYEAQLRHRCHELEVEKQRNQEYASELSKTREELQQIHDREKQQSQIIKSLEYQFAELNTEKQCLLDEISQSKAMYEASTSQLRAEVANLSHKLEEIEQTRIEQHVFQPVSWSPAPQVEAPPPASLKTEDSLVTSAGTLDLSADQTKLVTEDDGHGNVKLVEELRIELDNALANAKQLESDAQKSRQLYESTLEEVEHYKTTLFETEGILRKLQQFAQETEFKWQEQLREKEAQIDDLRAQLAQATSKSIEPEIPEVNQRLQEAQSKEKQQAELIQNLEHKFATLNTEKQSLLDQLTQSKVEHESEIDQLRSELARMSEKLNDVEQQILSSSSVRDHDTTPVDELRTELDNARARMSQLETDAQQSRQLYESTLEEVERYKATLVQTEDILTTLQNFARDAELKWQHELEEKQADCDRLRSELAELTSRVSQPVVAEACEVGSIDLDSNSDNTDKPFDVPPTTDRQLIAFDLAEHDPRNHGDAFDSDAVLVNYS